MKKSSGPYDVGYKKPPKKHQWRKGTSGNPAGKKKGSKSVKAMFMKAASKTVAVPGGPTGAKKMSLMELAVAKMFQHAIEGKAAISSVVIDLLQAFSPEPPTEAETKVGKITIEADGRPYLHYWLSEEHLRNIEELGKLKPSWELEAADTGPCNPVDTLNGLSDAAMVNRTVNQEMENRNG